MKRKFFRVMRVVVRVTLALSLVLAVVYGAAWVGLRGARLARGITEGAWPLPGVNHDMRGRLEIERVDWPPLAVLEVLLGMPVRGATATGVRVIDPRGEIALQLPGAVAAVELWPILFLGQIRVHGAHVQRAEMRLEAISTTIADQTEFGLSAAFSSKIPPSPQERGIQVDVRDLRVDDFSLAIREVGWSLDVLHARARADIVHHGGSPAIEGLGLHVEADQPIEGTLGLFGKSFPLEKIRLREFSTLKERPQDLRGALSGLIAGATVDVKATLAGFFGPNGSAEVTMDVQHAAGLLNRLVADLFAGEPSGHLQITGPLADSSIKADVQGVQLRAAPVWLGGPISARALIQGGVIDVPELRAICLGQPLLASAQLNLLTRRYHARVDIKNGDLGGAGFAGRLSATLEIDGEIDAPVVPTLAGSIAFELSQMAIGKVAGRGRFTLKGRQLTIEELVVSAAGADARLKGSVDLARGDLALDAGVDAVHPGRLIAALEHGRGLRAKLRITGSWSRPQASGDVSLRSLVVGPVVLSNVDGRAMFDGETLQLSTIVAHSGGGIVSGDLRVGPMGPDATMDLRGEAYGLGLGALLGIAQAKGAAEGSIELHGPLSAPQGTIVFVAPQAELAGFPVAVDGQVRVERDRLVVDHLRATQSHGGTLEVSGALAMPSGELSFRAVAKSVSLDRKGLFGMLDGELRVSGTQARPRLGGDLKASNLVWGSTILGDARLRVQEGPQAMHLQMALLEGLAKLDGELTLTPKPTVTASLTLAQLECAALFPELRDAGVTEAPATGRIAFAWNSEQGLVAADAAVTLRVTLRGEELADKVKVHSRGPIHVVWSGSDRRALIQAAEFTSAAGNFSVTGWMGPESSDLAIRGNLQLPALHVFLRRWVDSIQGEAHADLHIAGPPTRPQLTGKLELKGAFIVPRDVDKAFYVSEGTFDLSSNQVLVRQVQLQFGEARASIEGVIALRDFRPIGLALSLRGKLAAEVFEVFFPSSVATATGLFAVNLDVSGSPAMPLVVGTLEPRDVEISPRGMGQIVNLEGGRIRLQPERVQLENLRGRIDDGEVVLDGRIEFDKTQVRRTDVRIRGVNLSLRVPGQYEAEVSGDVRLTGEGKRFKVAGQVDLVDARYVQKFDVTELVIQPRTSEEREPPWAGVPAIENMQLELHVASTGAAMIKNNIAEIELEVALDVTGSPSAPRLHGDVRTLGGRFHIPLMLGEYTVDRGSVVFSRAKPILEAKVDLAGETLVEDIGGAEHTIRLTLAGTLASVQAAFSSTSGLDQGQIVALLSTGRTTEQIRAEARGDEFGSEGGEGGTGAGGPRGSAVDESLKQISGDLFNQLAVVDPFAKAFRLDTARIGVGARTVEFLGCYRIGGRRVEACGEASLYTIGGSRTEERLTLRLDNHFSVEAKGEQITQGEDTQEEDLSRLRLQLLSRWVLK